jgi:hypothetical protein
MAFLISYVVSLEGDIGPASRADISLERYDIRYQKCHIVILLSLLCRYSEYTRSIVL